MKLTKIFFAIATVLFAIACNPNGGNNEGVKWVDNGTLIGEWTLTSWAGSEEAKPQIYMSFNDDSTFDLYQQNYSVIWFHYEGRYALNNNVLSGAYADGTPLACDYKVEFSNDDKMIRLTSLKSASDVAIYTATEIPSWIVEEAKDPEAVRSVAHKPFF